MSSNEKSQFLTRIAADYDAPRVDRRCVTVRVIERASGSAKDALAEGWANQSDRRPDVWSPAATTWLLLLGQKRPDLVPPVAQSLIQSPLVIAIPEEMELILRTSSKRIGWHDVLTLAQDPQGWARFGKDWGPIRLGRTTPLISTSGLHALISLNNASQAEAAPLAFLQGVESSVPHYADSVRTFLANLRRADDAGRALQYVSAIAVEEKQVFDYNRGNTSSIYCESCEFTAPRTKLVAVYPKEGTLIADHPYAVLNWVDDEHRQAASDFQRHLESARVQMLFQKEGFRDHRRQAGDVLKLPYFDPSEPKTLYSPPTPAALDEMVNTWSASIRKRSNALIVLDVGPSLDTQAVGVGMTKLAAVKSAINEGLELLADDDEIGLWTFPSGDTRPYQEVLPITRRGPSPFGLSARLNAVRTVTASRAMYASIRAAGDRLQTSFMKDRVNALVVVSDGLNGTPDSIVDLLKTIRDRPDAERVVVLTVALSTGAVEDLRAVADASDGVFYDATNPLRIKEILRNVLANL